MKALTEIKTDFEAISLPIGLSIVAATPVLEILFVNDIFTKMLGFDDAETLLRAYHQSAWNYVYPDDVKRLRVLEAQRNGKFTPFEVTYRIQKKDGSFLWVSQNSRRTHDKNGNEIILAYYTDITAQRQTEQALRESEFRYATAVKAANINIWEYHYATDTMTIISASPKVNTQDVIIPNYLHSVISEKHIRDDSAPILFGMIANLKNGMREVTADLWIRENAEDAFWCERVIYTNVFDETGKPVKAYCVGRDITKEKEAEKRYRDELSYREAMQKATMASINANLTRNTILDYKSIFEEVTAYMRTSKTAQEYFEHIYAEITTPELKRQCAATFNRDALLRHFANGETTLSMELTRKIEGRRYWTVLTIHMMKQSEDNEIVAFLYSTDITNERTMQNVMRAIVKTDYDFLVVVDSQRNFAVRYSEKNLGNTYAQESEHFEEETQAYMRRYLCKEDAMRVVKEITIKNILTQLDTQETYDVFYKVPNKDGSISQKQLRFSYIDRKAKSFLMTRADITTAVMEQEKRNQELVTAVKMAERANAAKSEFLSRVSHEIRTPMNAIMGMNQLAAQHLNDPVFLEDCIQKSQYASQYLLLLLGDILDMSKIESGKVTLKHEIIVCKQFIDAVNTIIGAQAQAKSVQYVVTEFAQRKSCYIGDGVRLQQILINILSNAVKFTPAGGTVHLDITQVEADEKTAKLCFEISDTGIGISEAFMPYLFKPFSQEYTGSTNYGGTGLGLAISKNLAQLMNGNIVVHSVPGKGTTFKVYISLDIPSDSSISCAAVSALNAPVVYNFSGRRFLLVEDHYLNIMVAKKILEFKNAIVDVAENGQKGFEMFAAAPAHTYDAVLMDIRMPVMDGLQSTENIRNLNDTWAKEVPIIAMSANAFDDDVQKSKAAGMNAHLAKPIDAELLYATLHQLLK